MHPLAILAVGIATILGLIIYLRVHAFVALIVAAMLVSLLSPAVPLEQKMGLVAAEFGRAAGSIGIVIALAAVIGDCMMRSGAADRIVRAFLALLGQKRSHFALMGSGYVLAIPVFFDTVFYLLVPLARSLYRQTRKNYLLYILAIAAGGAITHTLVPPTPGPLIMASNLGVDIGMMILVGLVVALPAALAGVAYGKWLDARMPIPMREIGGEPVPEPPPDYRLPPLWLSLMPVVLPVLLITANTVLGTLLKGQPKNELLAQLYPYTQVIGNANFALLLSAFVAVGIYVRQTRPTLRQIAELTETSLMSAGIIILITAAGGAFGAMLKAAEIGPAIEEVFRTDGSAPTGMFYLFLGFGIASVMKIAQGSSTVAMITASGMLASMITSPGELGYHPVYLAMAIGAGSKIASWMNDSGFWIFAKMGGLTEVEALKSWTPCLAIMGVTAMTVTVIL
ncbi:MAG TPA: hypothetical protein VIL46_05175, partial [Gemmataceae bacterium]